MTILVIIREIPPVGGGAGSVALELARRLAERGHAIHVLTMWFRGLARHEAIGGVTIHRLRCGRRRQESAGLGSMIVFALRAWWSGRRVVRSGVDIVHAHAIVPDGWVAMRVAARGRVPFVITSHGTDVPGYDDRRFSRVHRVIGGAWRRVLRRAALLVTPSTYLADLIRARQSLPVEVIPNGIAVDLVEPRAKDGSLLIVSRLIARKNFASFFEALAMVERPVVVHVVGDGPERARLESLAAGTPHDVVFHGWLPHGSPEWRRLYEVARFFVFPSVGENFPVNLLEAQLAGMTVMASDVPGCREVLGDAAVYFEDLSPASIAATVIDCLERSDEDLDRLGARARQRVQRRFSWDTVTDSYERSLGGIHGPGDHGG